MPQGLWEERSEKNFLIANVPVSTRKRDKTYYPASAFPDEGLKREKNIFFTLFLGCVCEFIGTCHISQYIMPRFRDISLCLYKVVVFCRE